MGSRIARLQECANSYIVPNALYLPSERLLGLACSQEDNTLRQKGDMHSCPHHEQHEASSTDLFVLMVLPRAAVDEVITEILQSNHAQHQAGSSPWDEF